MTFPRRRASTAHSKVVSSLDIPLPIPCPSKSTPKIKSLQQATLHDQHSFDYTSEPTYVDFLSSIDDWLEPYSLSPSESSSSTQRRKRSTTGAIKSGNGSMGNATLLKPKSRSLRDATTATSTHSQLENRHPEQTCSYQTASTATQTQSQVPRAKSRTLKSPPPPPALESSQQPPCLPNVDIQQIKDELSVSVSANHFYFVGNDEGNSPRRSRHQRHASSSTATSKETASVIDNVKRRLSLKDRIVTVDYHQQQHQVASIQPKSTRSSPSATSGVGHRKSHSRTSLVDSSSTRRRSVYSPPPLPRPSTSYTIKRYSKRGEEESTVSDDGGGRRSAASMTTSATAQDHHDDDFIPPVPPVPKHHTLTSNSNTSSFISMASTSSTVEDDDMSMLALDAFGLLEAEQAQSLMDLGNKGDGNKSHQRHQSHDHNENAKQYQPSCNHPIMSPSTPSQKGYHDIPTNTGELESQQKSNNVKKTPNRKRGRTLPGSLATPPPMPSIPLPPMKLVPIHIDVMSSTPQQPSKSAAPHMPPPNPPSLLAHTSTKLVTKKEDNATSATHLVYDEKSPMTGSSSTALTTQLQRPSKLPSSSPKGAVVTPRMQYSRSASGKAPSTLPHSLTSSKPSLQRKSSSRNTKKGQSNGSHLPTVIPSYDFITKDPATTSTTANPCAKTPNASKIGYLEALPSSSLDSTINKETSTELGRPKSLHSTNYGRTKPDGTANRKDRSRALSVHEKQYPCPNIGNIKAPSTPNIKNSHLNNQQSRSDTPHAPVRTPKSPQTALKYYHQYLSPFERSEILDFKHIYFIGPHAKKHQGIITTRDHHHHRHQQQQQSAATALPQASSVYNNGYDDENGDYKIIRQDHLMYRYEIVQTLGQGSFGQVVKCYCHKTGATVAIKLIRNKQRFHAQGLTEIKLLRQLVDWDPEDKHHNIRMIDYFYFRHHLCIAFECMKMNLYEFIKKNNFQGFSVSLIRTFALQMLRSLALLYKHRVIHCDLKPENILLKHPSKHTIKVIDFGSSCMETERVYTYIQSRFYRSPEVIMGISYNMSIDMWSFGCILAELHTGIPLFPGENELDQLGCIMEVLGLPDRYLIEQSSRKRLFFDSQCNARSVVNSKGKLRQPKTRPLAHVLRSNDLMFLDFIQGCLQWDPANRMTPMDAMNHDWIQQRPSHTNPSSYQFPSNNTTNYQKLDEFNKALRSHVHHPPKTPKMTATTYIQSFRKHSVG